MKITVNRSSVCAGDDIDSHERTVVLDDRASCGDLLEMLKKSSFFASVSGNNVVWLLTAGGNHCVLAYYTKTGRISRLIPETGLADICKRGKLHFNYYCSPADWKSVIERCYLNNNTSVKREVWLAECDYCDRLSGK